MLLAHQTIVATCLRSGALRRYPDQPQALEAWVSALWRRKAGPFADRQNRTQRRHVMCELFFSLLKDNEVTSALTPILPDLLSGEERLFDSLFELVAKLLKEGVQ